MSEHNALGYWSGLALCFTKVRSSRACCPATALIFLSPNVLYIRRNIGLERFPLIRGINIAYIRNNFDCVFPR